MTPLERAVTFADGHHPPRGIAQQLDLDVARRDDLTLQIDGAVTECRGRLPGSVGEGGRQIRGPDDPPHPTPAATGRGLDQQREADRLGLGDDSGDLVGPIHRSRLERSGHRRHAHVTSRPPGMQLVPERVDRGRRRPDEDKPGILDGAGEGSPLRQEAVARMDRLRSGVQGDLDDPVDPQVALSRCRRPDPDRGVGKTDVLGCRVGVAIDRDRLHPQLAARPDDADRDLAAVCNQDSTERRTRHRAPVFAQRRARSERDVAMLLPRVRLLLVGQNLERTDQPRPCL